jgi:thymidylate kinase
MKRVYAIEGIDRLGKSTLIQSILNYSGFYQVMHFSKPEVLEVYRCAVQQDATANIPSETLPLYLYQRHSFMNSMMIAKHGRIIFDRWHLGEAVYAPLYRKYSGDYVFDLEMEMQLDTIDLRLILLTEDFETSRHFTDDGQSLGSVEARQQEQNMFIQAFHRSIIKDKRIVCVTDLATGGFKTKKQVFLEATQ